MQTTKRYIQNFWAIAGAISLLVATAYLAFAAQDSSSMIGYYCTAGNIFFGFHLQSYALCPVYVTLGSVLIISVVILLVGLLLVIVIDLITWALRKIIKPSRKEIKFSVMPLDEAVRGGYQYASILVKNEGDYDIEEFYGKITESEFLSEPYRENYVVEHLGHKFMFVSRNWEKKGINPRRRPLENDEGTKTIALPQGEEKRIDVAKCNSKSGVIILNQDENKPLTGFKNHANEIKITIAFRWKNSIGYIEKIYLLHYSYLKTLKMMIDEFEEYNEKDKKTT